MQETINRALLQEKGLFSGPATLKEAIEYVLLSPGRRFRPVLLLAVAKSLGGEEGALDAALAVECFHAASLIADDLPCMDNEEERRGRRCVHLVFDEKTALLASYSLIAGGYQLLGRGLQRLPESRKGLVAELALAKTGKATGASGASGGQFLDLLQNPTSFEEALLAIELKTVTLFQLSFSLGWLFGGGDPLLVDRVEKAASHFGLAFQINDDLGDYDEDLAKGHKMNIVSWVGRESAEKMFHVETKSAEALFCDLGLDLLNDNGLRAMALKKPSALA